MSTAPEVLAEGLDYYHLGHALWSPEPLHGDIYIGDVGHIDEDGAFRRLFNVTVDGGHPINSRGVPKNFERFHVKPWLISVRHDYFHPQPFISKSVKSHAIHGSLSLESGVGASAGLSFKLECHSSQGAILLLRDHATKTIMQQSPQMLEYIARNHDSWFDCARATYYIDCCPEDIIIVRGTLKTSAWTVATYSGDAKQTRTLWANCRLGSIAGAAIGATSSEQLSPNMQIRSGPSAQRSFSPPLSDAESTSRSREYENELPELVQAPATHVDSRTAGTRDQTVFLKYYKVKRRPVLPNKIVARAGYHELPRHHDFTPSTVLASSATSDDLFASERQFPETHLSIDDILDYILEHSDAQLAIASDDDILAVLEGKTLPEDVYRWLTEVRPQIHVNAQGVGTLADLSGSDDLLADSERPEGTYEPTSEGHSDIPFDEIDDPKRISAFFLAHFHSLWDQAVSYAEEQGLYVSHDLNYRYCTALAQYRSSTPNPQTRHVGCSFEFGPPHLEFRCQHDAELTLNIKRVAFLPTTQQHRMGDHPGSGELPDVQVTFAIPFRISSGFPGEETQQDEGGTSTLVFDLDLQRARMVATSAVNGELRIILEACLLEYLAFLDRAGHGTLFYPLIASTGFPIASIDFSRTSSELSKATHVQGVAIEEINRFLAIAWLMASTELLSDDDAALPLVECHGMWPSRSGEGHIRIEFGSPAISVLCDTEVILVLTIKAISFGEGDASNSNSYDWKVALLMNLERCEGANEVTQYRLDRLSSYFMPQFSQIPEVDRREQIVDFLSGDYLYMLEQTGGLIIFHRDSRTSHLSLRDAGPQPHFSPSQSNAIDGSALAVEANLWNEWAHRASMCGFDFVRALTESAINNHFRSLWQARASNSRLLIEWQYRDLCRIAFEPLTVLLLDDGTALLRVNVAEGTLKSSRNETSAFGFSNWVIAYKVKLALCDQAALSGLASGSESEISTNHPTEDFMHLYLDMSHAEFDLLHSRFEDLSDPGSVDKARTAVVFLRQYFRDLASSENHVLATVPLSASSPQHNSPGLTSVTFCVSPMQRPNAEGLALPAVVLILGMYDDRPLPQPSAQEWGQWCSDICSLSLDFSAISANSFLEQLLSILSEVNALTRVEPTFSEFQRQVWQLRLTTWAKQPERVPGDCSFAPLPAGTDGRLRFQWKLGRKFSTTGTTAHSVTCYTDNHLELLCGSHLEVILYGTIGLELKTRYWSSKGRATWKTTLKISFEGGSLEFSSVETPMTFETAVSQGRSYCATPLDPPRLLQDVLPASVKVPSASAGFERLKTVAAACDTARSGSEAGSCAFSSQGDLLLQIRHSLRDPLPAVRARALSPPTVASGAIPRVLPTHERQLLGVPGNLRDDEDTCSEASPLSSVISPTPISSMQSAYTPLSSATSSGFPSAGPKTTFSALRTLPPVLEVDVRPASTAGNLTPLAQQAHEIFSIPHSASIRASSASPTPSSASSVTNKSATTGRRRLSPSPPPITIPTQPLWRKAVTTRSRDGSTTSSRMGRERQEDLQSHPTFSSPSGR